MQRNDAGVNPLATLQTDVIRLVGRSSRRTVTFASRYPLGFISAVILAIVIFLAIAAPIVTLADPTEVKIGEFKETPSWSHPLGTDYQGRDILSRLIYGSRASLQVAVMAVLLGTTLGAVVGVANGYLGGRFDTMSQRILEIVMAFPGLILAMVLLVGLGSGIWTVIIAIGVTRFPYGARVVRGVALSVKENAYVEAARATGASSVRIMALHVAPQCIAPYLVLATAHLGVVIIIEASLGFLGIGIGEPTPTWGNMLGGAVSNVLIPHWPLVVSPVW